MKQTVMWILIGLGFLALGTRDNLLTNLQFWSVIILIASCFVYLIFSMLSSKTKKKKRIEKDDKNKEEV